MFGDKLRWRVFSLLLILATCSMCYADPPSWSEMKVTCPYWDGTFDSGGYSDVVNWSSSPYHPHSRHELLSGEWGAAVYYNGIATEPNVMWLTDEFSMSLDKISFASALSRCYNT